MPDSLGTIAPTSSRTFYVRLTARDNAVSGGRWAISNTLDNAKGLMVITRPGVGASIAVDSLMSMTWKVAHTENLSSIMCIRMLQSDDDGLGNDQWGMYVHHPSLGE